MFGDKSLAISEEAILTAFGGISRDMKNYERYVACERVFMRFVISPLTDGTRYSKANL